MAVMGVRRVVVACAVLVASHAHAEVMRAHGFAVGPAEVASVEPALAALAADPALVACAKPGAVGTLALVVETSATGTIEWADAIDATATTPEAAACLVAAVLHRPLALRGTTGRTFVRIDLEWGARTRTTVPPTIVEGSPTLVGSLDKSIINRILHRREAELDRCVGTTATTQFDLAFVIAVDGSVAEAHVVSATPPVADAVSACVVSVIRGWRFPKNGGLVQVRWPIAYTTYAPEPVAPVVRALPLPAQLEGTVASMVEAADGRLLVGTRGLGVYRFDGATAVRVAWPIDATSAERVVPLGGERYAVLGEHGASLVDPAGVHPVTACAARAALATADGDVWIGCARGLVRVRAGKAEPVLALDTEGPVTALAHADGNALWVAQGGHVYHYDPAIDRYRAPQVGRGHGFAIDRGGQTWAFGEGGLARLPAGTCMLACGAKLELIAAAWDRAGGVWIVEADGLRRIDLATREVSPPTSGVRDVIVTRDGGVVVATDGGLGAIAPVRARAMGHDGEHLYHVARTARGLMVSDLPDVQWLADPTGALVFVEAGRVWRSDGTTLRPIVELAGDAAATIWALDWSATAVMLGTDAGLFAGTARVPGTDAVGPVHALARVGDTLWIGGPRGLWTLRGSALAHVRTEAVAQLATGKVGARTLVVAATANGLFVIDGDDIQQITSAAGLTGDAVSAVAISGDTVVAATAGGLQFLRDGRLPIQTLSRVDGYDAVHVGAMAADPDGTIWLATDDGLRAVQPIPAPPQVALDAVALDGRAFAIGPGGAVDVPWSVNALAIAPIATSWIDRHENLVVELTARRAGEVAWHAIGPAGERSIELADLGGGDVELAIVARGVDGVASTPLIVHLAIGRPPWRRPAIVFAVLAVLGLGIALALLAPRAYRRRIAPRLALARARRALVAEPARTFAIALALGDKAETAPFLAVLARDPALPPDTIAWLRLIELLARDPDAGLRMARTRATVASADGWPSVLDWLGRIHVAPSLAEAAQLAPPSLDGQPAPLAGLAEALGVLGEADRERNLGKRWDYLRSAHDYLATLAEQAASALPRALVKAFGVVTTELRRRIAAQMREHDWREQQTRAGSDGGFDSRKLRFVVENEFPRPIARAYSRLGMSGDAAAKVPLVAALLEALLAFAAIALCAEARFASGGGPLRDELKKRLLQGAPSAGDWLALARSASAILRADTDRCALPALVELLGTDGLAALDDAVARRNRMIHRNVGITRADVDELAELLDTILWSLSAIRETKLVALTGALDGGDGAVVKRFTGRLLHGFHDALDELVVECNVTLPLAAPCLVAPRARRVVDLRPLCTWAECPQGDGFHLFMFARVAGKAVEYVSAEGHIKKDRDAVNALDAWLADGAPSRARDVELLAADVEVGDDAKRRLPAGYILPYEAGLEIDEAIGRGGFADVYRAHKVDDRIPIAVKLLPYQYLRDPGLVRRFRQEAAACSKLDDPHIVRVFGFGEDVGDQFILMELATGWDVGGKRVFDVAGLPKPQALAVALDIARQTLAGLAYVHGEGIIHRDIKPANLLLFDGGVVKIADFGTARTRESLHLTRTGVFAATPEYMAPEQASGAEVDLRADLYSVGVMLYELLAGTLPFRGDTPIALALARLRTDPIPLKKVRGDLPRPVLDLVGKLLAREPDGRPRTALEALGMLDAATPLPVTETG